MTFRTAHTNQDITGKSLFQEVYTNDSGEIVSFDGAEGDYKVGKYYGNGEVAYKKFNLPYLLMGDVTSNICRLWFPDDARDFSGTEETMSPGITGTPKYFVAESSKCVKFLGYYYLTVLDSPGYNQYLLKTQDFSSYTLVSPSPGNSTPATPFVADGKLYFNTLVSGVSRMTRTADGVTWSNLAANSNLKTQQFVSLGGIYAMQCTYNSNLFVSVDNGDNWTEYTPQNTKGGDYIIEDIAWIGLVNGLFTMVLKYYNSMENSYRYYLNTLSEIPTSSDFTSTEVRELTFEDSSYDVIFENFAYNSDNTNVIFNISIPSGYVNLRIPSGASFPEMSSSTYMKTEMFLDKSSGKIMGFYNDYDTSANQEFRIYNDDNTITVDSSFTLPATRSNVYVMAIEK